MTGAAGATTLSGMERSALKARLDRGPLLADGGMGTLLFSRGIPQRACLDELVASRPELVTTLHREYIEAGAELVETLSFGANRHRLAGWGLAGEAASLNRRAARLARDAREVSGREILVAGSIGPLGPPTRELAHLPDAEVRASYREQVDGLLEGGVDLFVVETFFDLGHLLAAVGEVRGACALPIVAEMTFGEELVAGDGSTPEAAAAALAAAGVDVVGVNCGVGPIACLDAMRRMAGAGLPRSIMPNAGLPQRVEGHFVYAAGPEYLAEAAETFVDDGAAIVGGCCGTTPAHVAAMRVALDGHRAAVAEAPSDRAPSDGAPAAPSVASAPPRATPVEVFDDGTGAPPPPTGLATALAEGRFVVSVEIDPPRSIRMDRTLEAARLLRDAGADVVNISDSAMARVRMGALAVAFAIQRDVGLETVVHVTTRDRNLMALESELLGAHALGVRNILALTGDPPHVGDYPTGTGVWDVDSIGLIEILARLDAGEDQAGSPIGQRAGFTIACALDPTAADAATEWDRLERKLAAGAHLVMTQPLYDVAQVEAMLEEARRRFGPGGIPVPVLLGILPLQSARHAEFLHNEVPGITVPAEARAAMAGAGERGAAVGVDLALALVEAVRGEVAGTYLMPSFGRYEQAAEVVRRIRASAPATARVGTPGR